MATLTCCLVGFGPDEARILESLVRLFRPNLVAEWRFGLGWQEPCDLLICDIDRAAGRQIWQQGGFGQMPCAIATAAAVQDPEGWVLRKPLRGHGPNGIIQILNQAAAMRMRRDAGRGAPQPGWAPEPEAVTLRPQMDPGAAFRLDAPQPGAAMPAVALLAPAPGPAPAAAVPAPAPILPPDVAAIEPPAPLPPLTAFWFQPPPPKAPPAASVEEPAPVDAPPPADPPLPDPIAFLGLDLPPEDAGAGPAEAAPEGAPSATGAMTQPAAAPVVQFDPPSAASPPPEPAPAPPPTARAPAVQPPPNPNADDDDRLRAILRGLRAPERPAPVVEEDDFLTLLNRLRSLRQVAVVRLGDLPPICVVPDEKAYHAVAALQDYDAALREQPCPSQVRTARNAQEGCLEAGCADSVARPLEQLFWIASLRCGGADVARHQGAAFRLRRWPDLGQLPHERHHMQWCGTLTRRATTLAALAEAAGTGPREVAAFLEACAELGILERSEAAAATATAPPAPVQDGRTRERVSIFRSILNRLGIGRA